MERNFIERRETGFYITGKRVPIDAVVWEYWNGEEPACIQSHYPTLTLEEVEGAITFYLSHREEVDKAIEENERAEEEYFATHPPSPEVKAIFERIHKQASPRRR
jgi:uncharacterized protein (DUF433 family)